jgi:hypothetical protein
VLQELSDGIIMWLHQLPKGLHHIKSASTSINNVNPFKDSNTISYEQLKRMVSEILMRRYPVIIFFLNALLKVDVLWDELLLCISRCYKGPNDSSFLSRIGRFMEVQFTHSKQLANSCC